MPSMPSMELDIAIPTSLSNMATRVRTSIPDLNRRLVIGVLGALVLGPIGLAAGYLFAVVSLYMK